MSETFFAINDLTRRKLQTSLVVSGLALCVASTLFLLLLGDKLGFGILSMTERLLTTSFSRIFSNFIIFIGLLVFFVGAVIVAFMVFIMMSQRIRDIGLMKATGCPNDLVFGYFMNELVVVTFSGCLLGVILGTIADYASTNLLNNMGFQASQSTFNIWLALIIFVIFFAISLIIGAKPILDAARIEPSRAMSPSYCFGLRKESDFRGSAKAGLTFKIALRNLFRRKSAAFRIILCLTTVFILVTVAIAGGLIADQTTKSWIEKAVGENTVLIAHHDICDRYAMLLSKFYETTESPQFNYTDGKYLISNDMVNQLSTMPNVGFDLRLVLESQVKEVEGWTLDPKLGTRPIGDSRHGTCLVIGIEPQKVASQWFVNGRSLGDEEAYEVMIGDSLAQSMFSSPLYQNMTFLGEKFDIVGVCLDPINNGNVTYMPLKILQRVTMTTGPNAIMARIEPSADRTTVLNLIRASLSSQNPEFEALELDKELAKATGFLGYIWSMIILLPLFTLSAASLCMMGYVVLTISEQRQEFGVLRAVGVKPKAIVKIVSAQSFMILISSYAVGISLGVIFTLMILVPEPVVTAYTVVEIAAWLMAALAITFLLSLYPAVRFAKKPIIEIMSQS